MPAREIGFGLYDAHKPTTSPTRKGGTKGRAQPRSLNQHTAPRGPVTPTPPSSRLFLNSTTGGGGTHQSVNHRKADCVEPHRVAAAENRRPAQPTAKAAPQVTTASTARALDESSDSAAHALLRASALRNAPTTHAAVSSPFSPTASYLENHIRCVVHLTGAHVLLPSLLEILQGVLRLLQQDRTQQKGQQPCRRGSSLRSSDLESEVTCCLTQAVEAPSLVAAAALLEEFLLRHAEAATPNSAATSSSLPCVAATTTTTCSPVVLLGATLAELYFSGSVPSCAISPSSLFTYLDAAVAAGHPGAMVCVGACLRDGKGGVEQNVKAGLTWMLCAASTGYLPALHELGETYEVGVQEPSSSSPALSSSLDTEDGGVDWGAAVRWYRQAAEAGYSPSQLNLGKLLLLAAEQGAQDESADTMALSHLNAEARRWLQACAAAGVEEAVQLLKRLK